MQNETTQNPWGSHDTVLKYLEEEPEKKKLLLFFGI